MRPVWAYLGLLRTKRAWCALALQKESRSELWQCNEGNHQTIVVPGLGCPQADNDVGELEPALICSSPHEAAVTQESDVTNHPLHIARRKICDEIANGVCSSQISAMTQQDPEEIRC